MAAAAATTTAAAAAAAAVVPASMKAVRVHQVGGPEALCVEEVPVPRVAAGQVLIRNHAIGVNFIDIYHRTGLYKAELPLTIGREGAGVVVAVGEQVAGVAVGDRVAYCPVENAYAEYVAAPVKYVVALPAELSFEDGAAALLQGLTAHYLVDGSYHLAAGDTALVHAAAGGVGRLLVQMCKIKGARVIGTVSTDDKAAVAREAGCDDVIKYTTQDFEAEVKRLTEGQGVHVVYDSVGKDTFEKSLACLRPLGFLVSYGNSSGKPPLLDISLLSKGSNSVIRPKLGDYVATRDEMQRRSAELFSWVVDKRVRLLTDQTFPLADVATAHRKLEGRQTKGKILLFP